MRKLSLFLLIFALGVVIGAQGPLTNLLNLRGRTDANGYLITTVSAYTGPDGPLTALSNIRGRTDANGYLLTTTNGPISFPSFLFANIATALTANGQVGYCSDCTIASTCAGSGTGAIAKRLNAVNVCN